jgi:site-specific recombinase XerD
MLTIYRRHRKECAHRSEGRTYRRCRCPIWADGFLGTMEIRRSTGLRDWEKAQELVRQWEAEGKSTPVQQSEPVSIHQSCEHFLQDALARKLREKTVYKYRLLFRRLEEFAEANGLRFLKEMDVATMRKFRASWLDGNLAALKKLERLRSFFRFAQSSKWIEDNPASELKNPKVSARPTMPFTHEEMIRILQGCDKSHEESNPTGKMNARRLRALVLLLRYSGMRIGDAVSCSTERLNGNKLLLYTQKTGVPVYCPLPDFVVKALEEITRLSERYFFWTGRSKLQTATGDWQAKLKKLFEKAELPDGHAHRFRDTFAVELLLAGVPLERVSVLLGHTSIRITERHYSPWVRARQEQAEADVRRAWEQDPVALLEAKGTPEVHEKGSVVN